jgi:hypothetical protein
MCEFHAFDALELCFTKNFKKFSLKVTLQKQTHRFKQTVFFIKIIASKVTHVKSIPTNFTQKLLMLCLQSNLEGLFNFIIRIF